MAPIFSAMCTQHVLSPDCSPFNERHRSCTVTDDVTRSSVLSPTITVHAVLHIVELGYNVMKGFFVVINERSYTEQNNVMVNSEKFIGTPLSDAIDGVWYIPLSL